MSLSLLPKIPIFSDHLYPYQYEFCAQIVDGLGKFNKVLAVLPTGGGKTVCFVDIATHFKKTLILAHREELIDQAVDKINRFTKMPVSVEMGNRRSSPTPIVVGSIQSLYNRYAQFAPDEFDLIVADEAHYSLADTWQTVLKYFTGKILGVTATPHRGDHRNLGSFYDTCSAEVTLAGLIEMGYLSRISCIQTPVQIDMSAVRTQMGDFNDSDLDRAVIPVMDNIVKALLEWKDRKILVFLPLIKTSQLFAATCRRCGLNAIHIDGMSPDRKEILKDYADNKIRMLCNANLLTHGYDQPDIDCVVILRPTQSQPLYCQMVGRGTRISPGKENLLLIDFLWLGTKHKLIRPAHLMATTEEEAEKLINKISLSIDEVDLLLKQQEVQEEREATLAENIKKNENKKRRIIDPVAWAMADGFIEEGRFVPSFFWEGLPATEAQLKRLDAFGFNSDLIQNRGHASKVLGSVFSRIKNKMSTPKQIALLARFGVHKSHEMTFDQAHERLNKIFESFK